jgi:hypothetical protein
MEEPTNQTSPRPWRPARSPVHDVRATLGTLECQVANLSTTGAMMRSRVEVEVGREMLLLLQLESALATVSVRVVRCEPMDTAVPAEAVRGQQEFAVGIMFLDPSRELAALVLAATREVSGS